jgi:hypothetical protein
MNIVGLRSLHLVQQSLTGRMPEKKKEEKKERKNPQGENTIRHALEPRRHSVNLTATRSLKS